MKQRDRAGPSGGGFTPSIHAAAAFTLSFDKVLDGFVTSPNLPACFSRYFVILYNCHVLIVNRETLFLFSLQEIIFSYYVDIAQLQLIITVKFFME